MAQWQVAEAQRQSIIDLAAGPQGFTALLGERTLLFSPDGWHWQKVSHPCRWSDLDAGPRGPQPGPSLQGRAPSDGVAYAAGRYSVIWRHGILESADGRTWSYALATPPEEDPLTRLPAGEEESPLHSARLAVAGGTVLAPPMRWTPTAPWRT